VLVNPGFPVPVSWSYANLNRIPRPAAPDLDALVAAMAAGDRNGIAAGVYNALEFAVRDKFPLVEILRSRLLEAGCAAVAVSGSGPTLFGLTPGDSAPVAERIRAEFGQDVWVQATTVRPGQSQ
jgi:4-diphosphocytidyl-2-C-methyl-D-erythritol kinase